MDFNEDFLLIMDFNEEFLFIMDFFTYCYRILRNGQLKAGYPVILLFPTKMDTRLHAANYQLHEFKVMLSYLVSGLLCWKLLSLLIFFRCIFQVLKIQYGHSKISLVDNHSIQQSKKTFKAKNEFLNSLSLTV